MGDSRKSDGGAQGLALRPIRDDDRDFLYEVYASTRAEELALVDWSAAEKEGFLRQQFAAQHQYYTATFTQARFAVVELGGTAIGRLYIDRRADEIRVIDIALLPAYRGRGFGRALMTAVLDEAGRAGKPVRIHVEQFNPAMRLYQRLGFRPRGAQEGVYRLMEWRPDGREPQAKITS